MFASTSDVLPSLTDPTAQETERVLHDHLASFERGIDAVLANYTDASVLLTAEATCQGMASIREFFEGFLKAATPEFWEAFELGSSKIAGEVGYITWSAKPAVILGTDTLVVRDGKIAAQTFTSFP